jgi:hypothetical protein
MANLMGQSKRGPKPGTLKNAPYYPERVLKMIRLRKSGLTLQEVAKMFDVTPAGVAHIIVRWGDWAEGQNN